MTVAETRCVPHHTKNAALGGGRRPVTEPSASDCATTDGASTSPELRSPSRNARGASCPIDSFMSARADMLRAWRRLLPAVSRAALREELRSTTSAMRQLMRLRE